MDPDAALVRIRALIAVLEPVVTAGVVRDDVCGRDWSDEIAQLCELTRELDGWLARGGFLPASWKR